jgi:hypothetical protein
MNYIGDDFSWDKLIVISYPGGYGGDFFCNLLQLNYDPNHTFSPNENNKFEWVVCNNAHKSTDIIFDFYQNRKKLDKFKFEYIKCGPTGNICNDFDYSSFRETSFFKHLNIYLQIENEFLFFKVNYRLFLNFPFF